MSKKQLYVLKVALSHDKTIWRRIEILGSQSMERLHETIFSAFDRYDPHLYSFYLTTPGSKARDRFHKATEITDPNALEDSFGWGTKKFHDASKTQVSHLNLKVKGKFEYLFDFGDEWLHEITVQQILDIFPDKEYPMITTKKGESPPQYPEDEMMEEESDYNYEDLEKECDTLREANKKILLQFRKYLAEKKLSKKTIKKHHGNVDFFINEFLLYEEPLGPEEGVERIDYFLGYWFGRKALWATVTSVKENIASLKRFYTFMCDVGRISEEALADMKAEIKESKGEWIEAMQRYDEGIPMDDDDW